MNATGFQPNREYSSQQPWEHIDTMTGGLVLSFTDLVLPGNAGRELRFQRIYNSKGTRGWTFGVAGVPMYLTAVDWPYLSIEAVPTFIMADGSEHRAALWLNPINQGTESYRLAATDQFWRYDRAARQLLIPDGTLAQFDATGRLSSVSDPFGNAVVLTWEAARLRVVQTLGTETPREVVLALSQLPGTNPISMPTSMTYDGKTWTYEGTRVVPPVGPAWQFTQAQDTLTVTTPHGGTVRYDFETKLLPQTDGTFQSTVVVGTRTANDGRSTAAWRYAYTFLGSDLSTRTEVIDPSPSLKRTVYEYGHETPSPDNNAPYHYEGRNYVLKSRTVYGPGPLEEEQRTYRYVSVMSRNSGDALPELERRTTTRYAGASSRSYTTQYTYSATNYGDYHLPSQIMETGDLTRTTTRAYQHLATPFLVGNLTSETTVGAQSFTRSSTYDASTGFRTSETIAGITTTFESDAAGNVRKATKANGKWTSFSYSRGQVAQTTTPEYFVTREINADGTVASETRAGRRTTYTFDAAGRLETTQAPGGTNPIRTEYDNVGGTWVRTTRGGSVVTRTLDGFGRPVGAINGVGVRTVSKYDVEGRKTYESYPFTGTGDGIGTTIEYDNLDRVTKESNPGNTFRLRAYGLDTVTVTDENLHHTVYTHSAFGHPDDARLTAVTDADQKPWTYEYDVAGALTRVNGPGGVTRTWEYDTRHLLIRETHPESGTVTYTSYDAAGVLKQKTDARGTIFQYGHDANDRVRSIGAGSKVTQITYEAGSDNRIATKIGSMSSAFRYDPAGRLEYRTDTIDGRSFSARFEYDANDNLTDITYPSGRKVRYQFDSENRIMRVFRPATNQDYAIQLGYHPSGALSGYTAGNAIATAVAFHPQRYWVSSIQAGALQLSYSYDDVGNVRSITDPRPGMNQLFTYDALDRLATAAGPYGPITFTYDAHGNRQGADYTYAPDNPFRLQSFAGLPMTYDGNGNLLTGSQASYTYTPDNLMEVSTVGGTVARFTYDADDWRLKKAVDGGATTYYIRGPSGQLLTEWSITGTAATVRDYIYAGSRLLTVAVSQTTP